MGFDDSFMKMHEVIPFAPDYPRVWDTLWNARNQSEALLQKALGEPVHPRVSQEPLELYGPEDSMKMLVDGHYRKLRDHKRTSLDVYKTLSLKKEIKPLISLSHLLLVATVFAGAEWLFYHQLTPAITIPKVLLVIAIFAKLFANGWAYTGNIEDYYQRVIQTETVHDFYIFASGLALESDRRDLEVHFMAKTAASLLDTSNHTSEKEKSTILRKLAEERGSHHAAHALWILQQRYPDSVSQAPLFFHPPSFTNLTKGVLEKDLLSRDILEMVLRFRPDLRREFLERPERAQEENVGQLARYYDLAIDLERQDQLSAQSA